MTTLSEKRNTLEAQTTQGTQPINISLHNDKIKEPTPLKRSSGKGYKGFKNRYQRGLTRNKRKTNKGKKGNNPNKI